MATRQIAILAILLLTSCQPHTFDTVGDAVGYCMVLGEVPVRVDGEVTCGPVLDGGRNIGQGTGGKHR